MPQIIVVVVVIIIIIINIRLIKVVTRNLKQVKYWHCIRSLK